MCDGILLGEDDCFAHPFLDESGGEYGSHMVLL